MDRIYVSSSFRKAVCVFLGALTFVVAVLLMTVRLVIPPPVPPAVPVPVAAGPALTQHLVFIIIDGLRYDVALDRAAMPFLSRQMAEHRSAEIWCGTVSVTSSAVLTYGTGQRGDLEQIIKNELGTPVVFNDLIGNAKSGGLLTASAGARVWLKLYPNRWDYMHPDPPGVALDVDHNAEIFAASREFLHASPRPNFSVHHFIAPDHQGHAHGTFSDKYRAHIRAFDKQLESMIAELPDDTTLIITSDHGAAASGTHGTDTPEQRRSPLVAFGPGIAKGGVANALPLDQVDLAGTMAALLGIPAPAHGRGHVLVDWLDMDDEHRAKIACGDLARLSTYTRAAIRGGAAVVEQAEKACTQGNARTRIEAAAVAAKRLDQEIGESRIASRYAWLAPPVVLILALALALFVVGRGIQFGKASLVGIGLITFAISTVYSIELLPGRLPDIVRVIGYLTINGAFFWGVFRRHAAAGFLDARPFLGAALMPGLVVVSETKTTQPESFILAIVLLSFALLAGLPQKTGVQPIDARRASPYRLVTALLVLIALIPVGISEKGFIPTFFDNSPKVLFLFASGSIALFATLGKSAEPDYQLNPFKQMGLVAIAVASLWMRRMAPAPICLAGWLGLGVAAAMLAIQGGRRAYVELLALGSFAWVSRDAELPLFVATYVIARYLGDALRGAGAGEGPIAPSLVLSVVTFLFAWTYVQRVAIQLGLNFDAMDWGAGGFRQQGVSFWRIAFAVFYKHSLARAFLLAAVLIPLAPRLRVACIRGILLCEITRTAMLTAMLHVCRHSFWTTIRVIADAPHALSAVIVTAGAYVVIAASMRTNPRRNIGAVATVQ
ncbi:MAG TPA: alkaline phosphatase family protein [Polyangium sp.]|nr:alkaline phosphatase family protein [Polyangium sp.]